MASVKGRPIKGRTLRNAPFCELAFMNAMRELGINDVGTEWRALDQFGERLRDSHASASSARLRSVMSRARLTK